MEKNYFTVSNKEYSHLLLENIISLRTLGNYNGNIFILDYGVEEEIKQSLERIYNAEFIIHAKEDFNKETIVTNRFVQIAEFLKDRRRSSNFIADADTWMNSDVNEPFKRLNLTYRQALFTVYSPYATHKLEEIYTKNMNFHREQDIYNIYKGNFHLIVEKYKGIINAGVMFCTKDTLIDLLEVINEFFNKEIIENKFGSDEKIINYFFDESIHDVLDKEWNFSYTSDDYSIDDNILSFYKIIHLVGYKDIKRNRFHNFYPEIFQNELKKLHLDADIIDNCCLLK